MNFNSRPHGGRLCPNCLRELNLDISTHALTEGDTDAIVSGIRLYISTHALTEGDVLPLS